MPFHCDAHIIYLLETMMSTSFCAAGRAPERSYVLSGRCALLRTQNFYSSEKNRMGKFLVADYSFVFVLFDSNGLRLRNVFFSFQKYVDRDQKDKITNKPKKSTVEIPPNSPSRINANNSNVFHIV